MSGELPRVDATSNSDQSGAKERAAEHPDLAALVARTDATDATVQPIERGVDLGVVAGTSFEDFYRSSRSEVARALAMTLRDVDLATDSVDEAFARAYQRWDQVSGYDNAGGWVYRVALNHATSRLRQIRRRTARRNSPHLSVEHIEHLYADPEVGAALAQLSVSHRSVVVCRLLLGWSEKDTAAALDIRPGTVKSRLSRALAQLQSRLTHLRTEES